MKMFERMNGIMNYIVVISIIYIFPLTLKNERFVARLNGFVEQRESEKETKDGDWQWPEAVFC